MPAKPPKTPSVSTTLILRGPSDLSSLGPFLKARRRAAGFRSAKEAAPLLGVTSRLLREVERGERIKRGITLGKLLAIVQQLGYEVQLRPRGASVVGTTVVTLPPLTLKGTGSLSAQLEKIAKQNLENPQRTTNETTTKKRKTKKRATSTPRREQGGVPE
jgi:hypothetical protein